MCVLDPAKLPSPTVEASESPPAPAEEPRTHNLFWNETAGESAARRTVTYAILGMFVVAPIEGFLVGGLEDGVLWTCLTFAYLAFLGVPFLVAGAHDAAEDVRKGAHSN